MTHTFLKFLENIIEIQPICPDFTRPGIIMYTSMGLNSYSICQEGLKEFFTSDRSTTCIIHTPTIEELHALKTHVTHLYYGIKVRYVYAHYGRGVVMQPHQRFFYYFQNGIFNYTVPHLEGYIDYYLIKPTSRYDTFNSKFFQSSAYKFEENKAGMIHHKGWKIKWSCGRDFFKFFERKCLSFYRNTFLYFNIVSERTFTGVTFIHSTSLPLRSTNKTYEIGTETFMEVSNDVLYSSISKKEFDEKFTNIYPLNKDFRKDEADDSTFTITKIEKVIPMCLEDIENGILLRNIVFLRDRQLSGGSTVLLKEIVYSTAFNFNPTIVSTFELFAKTGGFVSGWMCLQSCYEIAVIANSFPIFFEFYKDLNRVYYSQPIECMGYYYDSSNNPNNFIHFLKIFQYLTQEFSTYLYFFFNILIFFYFFIKNIFNIKLNNIKEYLIYSLILISSLLYFNSKHLKKCYETTKFKFNNNDLFFENLLEFESFIICFFFIIFIVSLFLNFKTIKNMTFETIFVLNLILFTILELIKEKNLILIYLLLEIQVFSFFFLISLSKSQLSSEVTIKYVLINIISSSFFLLSIFYIYRSCGCINLLEINKNIFPFLNQNEINNFNYTFNLSFFILILVFFMKIGIPPVHVWYVNIYTGTFFIFFIFLLTFSKISYLIFFFNIFNQINFFIQDSVFLYNFICFFVFFTFLIGILGAISEKSIKRILIYSSIYQSGFFLFLLFYSYFNHNDIINFSFFSNIQNIFLINFFIYFFNNLILLFFFFFLKKNNNERFDNLLDLKNIEKKKNKIFFFFFFFSIFSTIGIPPLLGFFSKYYIFSFLFSKNLLLLFFSIIASVLGSFYYLKIINFVFFKEIKNIQYIKTFSFLNYFSLYFLVLISFIFPFYGLNFFDNVQLYL